MRPSVPGAGATVQQNPIIRSRVTKVGPEFYTPLVLASKYIAALLYSNRKVRDHSPVNLPPAVRRIYTAECTSTCSTYERFLKGGAHSVHVTEGSSSHSRK